MESSWTGLSVKLTGSLARAIFQSKNRHYLRVVASFFPVGALKRIMSISFERWRGARDIKTALHAQQPTHGNAEGFFDPDRHFWRERRPFI
jgi:hypothetical protein